MTISNQMFAKIILASKATSGAPPIITIHARYPRPIHGEVLTHRKFGRNARSSRAVPVKTMLEEVRNNPFVPWHWGKNQKGMQATEECSELVDLGKTIWGEIGMPIPAPDAWMEASKAAASMAEAFMNAGYHKQIANRLLEPFSYIDTLLTSTSWKNFFWLRERTPDYDDAEPHFQDLAGLVREAINSAEYQTIEPGQWHLPFIRPQELKYHPLAELQKISAARCARISYKPFDGDGSIEGELARFDKLIGSSRIHASPMEHQASPDTWSWQETVRIEGYTTTTLRADDAWDNPHLSGNLDNGWIQFRKTIEGEFVPG